MNFNLSHQIAQIMPHDFGNSEMIDFSELQPGQGIPECIRRHFNERGIYYYDPKGIRMTAVANARITSVVDAYHTGHHELVPTLRMHPSD